MCNLVQRKHHCLVLLMESIVREPLEDPIGIQTVIGSQYPEFSHFTMFSLSFVDAKFAVPWQNICC